MNDRHPIDERFKKGLQDQEQTPSDQVWEKVRAQIPQSSKRSMAPLLRAAVIVLLVGLSSVMYFNRNEQELMDFRPVAEESQTQPAEPAKVKPKTNTSQKEATKTEKEQSEPVKVRKQKGMPVLQAPTKKAYRMVEYRVPVANESALRNEAALWESSTRALASLSLETTSEPKAHSYKMVINLPEVDNYYGLEDTTEPDPELKEKVWAYATDQFNRLLAGDKPQLPQPRRWPSGVIINVPNRLN